MLELSTPTPQGLRIIRRSGEPCGPSLAIRPMRPSPFTTLPYADAWIENEGDGILTLQVGERCFAVIQGLDMDCQSLNQLLDRFRHRPPLPRR